VPDTFEALSVLVLALLPGAVFVYTLERQTGAWGVKAADRLLRFFVLSALLHLFAAPLSFVLWRRYVLHDYFTGTSNPSWPWPLYAIALFYVLVPAIIGTVCGRAVRSNQPWARHLFRQQMTAPRAFDYLFGRGSNGFVRILLKVDPPTWVAGAFVTLNDRNQGFVGRYPESPDVWLPVRIACDPETGAFQTTVAGEVVVLDGGLLVDGSSIAYLEFIEPGSRE
jgi:Family of unknown function (DUF6338)